MTNKKRLFISILATSALALTSCTSNQAGTAEDSEETLDVVNIAYANYNPLSLVIRDQGWLEEALDDTEINWVLTEGSNEANEYLRSGTIDIGSAGGGPVIQARANGTPLKTIYIPQELEGYGIAVPKDSNINSVTDLEGQSVAVTRGTNPYFFLLQALELHDVDVEDVTLENLQHGDGRAALENGTVDAWSGFDPLLSTAEIAGNELIYENASLISPDFLNAHEDFIADHPEIVQTVVDTFEEGRDWILNNEDKARAIYQESVGLDDDVAELAFSRFNYDISGLPDPEALEDVLRTTGEYMVESGDVRSQEDLDEAIATVFDTSFAENITK